MYAPAELLQRGCPANPSFFMCSPCSKSRLPAPPAPVAVRWHGAVVTQCSQVQFNLRPHICECAPWQVTPLHQHQFRAAQFCPERSGSGLGLLPSFSVGFCARAAGCFCRPAQPKPPLGLALARAGTEVTRSPLWKCVPPRSAGPSVVHRVCN